MPLETGTHLELEKFGIKQIEVGDGKDFFIAVTRRDRIAEVRDVIANLNGQYSIEEVLIGEQMLIVEANDINVYQNPEPSRSVGSEVPGKDSQASYYFRSGYESPAVQGYYLAEGATTSHHHHNEHLEELIPISGHSKVIIEGAEEPFERKIGLETGVQHMLKGGPGGAVIVCVTYGEGNCFKMDDHHYHPKPPLTPKA